MTMIEAVVDDVVMRIPGNDDHRVVLLKEQDGERVLPIWIGVPEADALVLQRSGRTGPRPLGPDLTAKLLQAGGVRLARVVIESLGDSIFHATIVVAAGGEAR